LPYKFQPGHVNFEYAWGMTGLLDYYDTLYHSHYPGSDQSDFRHRLSKVSDMIQEHENQLSTKVLHYLKSKPKVHIIGQDQAAENRVPTISFVVDKTDSESIVLALDEHQIGVRFGDFYAKRLIEDLGLAPQNGVVRISMVHYNTLEEVDKLLAAMDDILAR
jgi:selenocysteine lyase/cysteine desulfurase